MLSWEEPSLCTSWALVWGNGLRHFPIIHLWHGYCFPRWNCRFCPKYTLSQRTRIEWCLDVPLQKCCYILRYGFVHTVDFAVSCVLIVIGVFDLSSWPPSGWNHLQMQIKPQNFWTFSLPNYKEAQWSIITCQVATKQTPKLSSSPTGSLGTSAAHPPSSNHPTFHMSPHFCLHCSSFPTRNKRTFCRLFLCQDSILRHKFLSGKQICYKETFLGWKRTFQAWWPGESRNPGAIQI